MNSCARWTKRTPGPPWAACHRAPGAPQLDQSHDEAQRGQEQVLSGGAVEPRRGQGPFDRGKQHAFGC